MQCGVSRWCQGFYELDYFCTVLSTEGVELWSRNNKGIKLPCDPRCFLFLPVQNDNSQGRGSSDLKCASSARSMLANAATVCLYQMGKGLRDSWSGVLEMSSKVITCEWHVSTLGAQFPFCDNTSENVILSLIVWDGFVYSKEFHNY